MIEAVIAQLEKCIEENRYDDTFGDYGVDFVKESSLRALIAEVRRLKAIEQDFDKMVREARE